MYRHVRVSMNVHVNEEKISNLYFILHGLLFVADPGGLTLHNLMEKNHNQIGTCSVNCQVL